MCTLVLLPGLEGGGGGFEGPLLLDPGQYWGEGRGARKIGAVIASQFWDWLPQSAHALLIVGWVVHFCGFFPLGLWAERINWHAMVKGHLDL